MLQGIFSWKKFFCEIKFIWIRKSLPNSRLQFFPLHQCKKELLLWAGVSYGNNDFSEDLHHLRNIFSLSLCFISEKHNHCLWFDMRKLRHSTEEMKAVAEEKRIINSLFPGWWDCCFRLCLCHWAVWARRKGFSKGTSWCWGPAPTLCANRDVLFQPSCCLVSWREGLLLLKCVRCTPGEVSFHHAGVQFFWSRIVLWCHTKYC